MENSDETPQKFPLEKDKSPRCNHSIQRVETNKTAAEYFLNQTQKDFDGLVWRSPEEKSFLAFMLTEFSTQQSKEKDERIEALERELQSWKDENFENVDMGVSAIIEKDEEIKRLRDFLRDCSTNLKMFNHNDLTDFEKKLLERIESL